MSSARAPSVVSLRHAAAWGAPVATCFSPKNLGLARCRRPSDPLKSRTFLETPIRLCDRPSLGLPFACPGALRLAEVRRRPGVRASLAGRPFSLSVRAAERLFIFRCAGREMSERRIETIRSRFRGEPAGRVPGRVRRRLSRDRSGAREARLKNPQEKRQDPGRRPQALAAKRAFLLGKVLRFKRSAQRVGNGHCAHFFFGFSLDLRRARSGTQRRGEAVPALPPGAPFERLRGLGLIRDGASRCAPLRSAHRTRTHPSMAFGTASQLLGADDI